MRARPKILLCRTFEEAWTAFTAYRRRRPGRDLGRRVPARTAQRAGGRGPRVRAHGARALPGRPGPPPLVAARRTRRAAREAGADFLLKGSPVAAAASCGGSWSTTSASATSCSALPDGARGRAAPATCAGLEEKLRTVPAESVAYHARAQPLLEVAEGAHRVRARPRAAAAQGRRLRATPRACARHLIDAIADYRRERSQAVVADFDRAAVRRRGATSTASAAARWAARRAGLAFVRRLLAERAAATAASTACGSRVPRGGGGRHRRLRPVPRRQRPARLRDRAPTTTPSCGAASAAARLPRGRRAATCAAFLERVRLSARRALVAACSRTRSTSRSPASTRRSCCANNDAAADVRLDQLLRAIKRVYASTFTRQAKDYLRATPYRLEEEKMAVILQQVVGAPHGARFYPDFAGVARSHNFYPVAAADRARTGSPPSRSGWGATVVDGGSLPALLPAPSAAPRAVLVRRRRRWRTRSGRSGPSRWTRRTATRGRGAPVRPRGRGGGRHAGGAGLHLVARERRRLRRRSRAPACGWSASRRCSSTGRFPLAEILRPPARDRARGAWARRWRSSSRSTCPCRPARRGSSASCSCGRSRCRARREELEIGDVDAATRCSAAARSVLGNGRIDELRDLVVVDRQRFDRAPQPRDGGQELAPLQRRAAARRAALPPDRRRPLGLARSRGSASR